MGKCVLLRSLPPEGSHGRLTESQQRIDEMTTVRLTFSEMHQGVKGWHVLPLDAEVSGATSQASLSYLCQVTAREQSKEQWCWDHVAVIPQLRKVIETIYRNLDSLPVISVRHNKPISPEEECTFPLHTPRFAAQAILVNVLPGRVYISVDSCSLDGCLLRQGEHRKIIRCSNKKSSKGSLLTCLSFCHKENISLIYISFSRGFELLQRVLINVKLHSPCFHFAKVDNPEFKRCFGTTVY